MREREQRRETLGRLVRQNWIAWAKEQPSPKPSWLVEWDELAEPDKEVDRRIGEAVMIYTLLNYSGPVQVVPPTLPRDLVIQQNEEIIAGLQRDIALLREDLAKANQYMRELEAYKKK